MDDMEGRLRDLGERAGKSVRAPAPPPWVSRRSRLRRVLTSLGAVSVVILVAVGGYAGVRSFRDTPSMTVEGNLLTAAALATQGQQTARAKFEMTMSMESQAFFNETEAVGLAQIDFSANRSSMRMEMKGASAFMGSGVFEVIQDGSTTYIKSGPSGSDCKWMEQENPMGATGSSGGFGGTTPDSPSQYLEQLTKISGRVSVIGSEEIDGIEVTHYEAEIDPDLMLEHLPDEARATLEAQFENLEVDLEPVQVWVDGDNLVRKIDFESASSLSMDTGVFGDQEATMSMQMKMHFSMSFFDFGTPVSIDVPARDDVVDFNAGLLVEECFSTASD